MEKDSAVIMAYKLYFVLGDGVLMMGADATV